MPSSSDWIETSALADVLDEIGLPNQVVSARVAPMTSHRRFSGRAACASYAPKGKAAVAPVSPTDDFDAVDRLAGPGVVVVLCANGAGGAMLGGLMTREFRRRGAAAVIADGDVRDLAEMDQLGMPVFACGRSPVNGARRLSVETLGEPLSLPGANGIIVTVSPNDLLVGDEDGLVVVPAALAEDVIAATLLVSKIERTIVAAIDAGTPRVDAMRTRPRFAHLAALRERIARQGGGSTTSGQAIAGAPRSPGSPFP